METARYSGKLRTEKTFILFFEMAEGLTLEEKNLLSMQKILDYTEKFCRNPSVGYFEQFLAPLVCRCAEENYISPCSEKIVFEPFARILKHYEQTNYLDPYAAAEFLKTEILESPELDIYRVKNRY